MVETPLDTIAGRATQTGVTGACQTGPCRADEGGAGHGGMLCVCFHSHAVNGVLSAAYLITRFLAFLLKAAPRLRAGVLSLLCS